MLTDEELVERVKSGDLASFETLMSRHEGMVFNVAWSMSGDWDLAQDITQEVFVKAYSGLSGFRGTSTLKTWLYRIVVNQSLRSRGQSARRSQSEFLVDDLELVSEERSPDESAQFSEMDECIREAITQLPESERMTVTLRYLEDLSLAEIAEVMGVPLGTVKSRLHFALKRMNYLLRDWKDV